MLARVEGGQVELVTRNGNDWTTRLPGLAKALRSMDLPDGWYDGEIIMPGEDVPPTSRRCSAPSTASAPSRSSTTCSTCRTVRTKTFGRCRWWSAGPCCSDRGAQAHANVRFSAVFDAAPQDMLESACRLGWKGVIAKRRDSAYVCRRPATGSS
jgi:bifunctional non-homologous end joining protein LigD